LIKVRVQFGHEVVVCHIDSLVFGTHSFIFN